MKFKIDENLPVELAEVLRSNHHDAATVSEQEMSGAADSDVAEVCRQEKRILVTLDLDFADIRAYPPQQYAGIIVLRVQRQDKRHITTVFKKVIAMFERESINRTLWIVEENRIRVRD